MDSGVSPRRVALVSGGAVRIGRAISCALAAAGYDVAVHAQRSRSAAEDLAATIRASGRRAAVVTGDLGEQADLARLVAAAAEACGPITLLVNNACAFEPDALGQLTPEQWDRHFSVNLRAPIFLAQAFAAQVPEGSDASIVNLLDQRVLKPNPTFFSYSLTKSALAAATATMAQALAPRIRVNAVAPGPTVASRRQDVETFRRQSESVLLGRGPRPEEVADAVVFLARSASITGQIIAVDGGQHLAWQTPDIAGITE
jgi:NAD(P)-dependent dehydrogenase (short-subunit alcohol dehydrogenase family)